MCAHSESFFPAFAYVFTGEIFLSNAEGDCSISIYKEGEGIADVSSDISYRLFHDQGIGKIIWSRRSWDNSIAGFTPSKTYLLEFSVDDGVITDPFPLVPRLLLEEPWNFGNIYHPDLSPDGDSFIVAAYESGETEGYIWEFDIPGDGPVDIDNKREVAYLIPSEAGGLENATFHGPLYGLMNQPNRVYFGYDYPDRKYAYVELNDGSRPTPVQVAERFEGHLDPGSIGLWDFGDGVKEVMSLSGSVHGNGAIEILDVDACVANPDGDDCVILDSIQGSGTTSFATRSNSGPLPILLYMYDVDARNVGYSIRECVLNDEYQSSGSCYRTVIDGIKDPTRTLYGVDSAD
jgi:hypothetical protein